MEYARTPVMWLPVLIIALGFIPVVVGSDSMNSTLTSAIVIAAWSLAAVAVYITAYRPLRRLAADRNLSITRMLVEEIGKSGSDTNR